MFRRKDRRTRTLFYDMLAAEEARFPVVVRKFVNADAFARGGVDKFAFAEVDAAVGSALFICFEKDEIAGDELLCALCP